MFLSFKLSKVCERYVNASKGIVLEPLRISVIHNSCSLNGNVESVVALMKRRRKLQIQRQNSMLKNLFVENQTLDANTLINVVLTTGVQQNTMLLYMFICPDQKIRETSAKAVGILTYAERRTNRQKWITFIFHLFCIETSIQIQNTDEFNVVAHVRCGSTSSQQRHSHGKRSTIQSCLKSELCKNAFRTNKNKEE